jgi:2-oxoglutarate ferredoxin oxidoreductase subunit alpha
MFDLTIEAFNLSEEYRVPVFLLPDANIGHLYERLDIPAKEEIRVVGRKKPKVSPEGYKPFEVDESLVPPMACFGEGYRFYATGLTHDENGYPDMTTEGQDRLVRRLCDKIRRNADRIQRVEEYMVEDCDLLVVAYGITARSAMSAVRQARAEGIKAGLFRLITLWPFPDKKLEELAGRVKAVVVAEMNYGQLVREVERAARPTRVTFLPKIGDEPPRPDEILTEMRRALHG